MAVFLRDKMDHLPSAFPSYQPVNSSEGNGNHVIDTSQRNLSREVETFVSSPKVKVSPFY